MSQAGGGAAMALFAAVSAATGGAFAPL